MFLIDMDGQRLEAAEGETLLTVARRACIEIPTLCFHAALSPHGACRLCVVEVSGQDRPGSRLVTSCEYPAAPDLVVDTRSEKVLRARRDVADLLVARAPRSSAVRRVALSLGVEKTSFEPDTDRDNCILCGLCTRICARLGHCAITIMGRGSDARVGTPLDGPPPGCVGCGSCANVCPTDNIPVAEAGGKRTIWDRSFDLHRCTMCGRAYITKEQMEYRARASGLDEGYFDLCDECSRRSIASKMLEHVL